MKRWKRNAIALLTGFAIGLLLFEAINYILE